jgi:hypothetical protein
MTNTYVLYDNDLDAAYDVDAMTPELVELENDVYEARGDSVRWIPIVEFQKLRPSLVL